MKLSPRESILALATCTVVIFGVSFIVAHSKFGRWKELNGQQNDIATRMDEQNKLIEQKVKWQAEFSEFEKLLPKYQADSKVDVQWLSVMDRLASRHGVGIGRRQAGIEKKVGDVYELPIDCFECEGKEDAMIHFLFDLQAQGAMLDMRYLNLKTKAGGLLRAQVFTLYCAYLREKAKP